MNKSIKKAILTLTILALAAFSVLAATGTAISNETGLRNAFANGGTFYLSSDITLTAPIEGSKGKTIVIDLNGYDISCGKYYIEIGQRGASKSGDGSKVTIKDTSEASNGCISASITNKDVGGSRSEARGSLFYINSYSSLTIQGADILIAEKTGLEASKCHGICGYGNFTVTGNSKITSVTNSFPVLDITTYSSIGSACTIGEGVEITGNVKISEKASITLNGGTIKGDVTSSNSSKININSGTLDGTIKATGSSSLTVTGGEVTGNVNIASKNAKATISGGQFDAAVYSDNGGKITATGGSFATNPSNIIPDGQFVYKNSENKYVVLSDTPAVILDDTPYLSFDEALTAAEDGDTLKIYKDITKNLTINKDVTIDLAGNTLTGSISAAAGTKVVVKDSDDSDNRGSGEGYVTGTLSIGTGAQIEIQSGRYSSDPTSYLAQGKYAKYDKAKTYYIVTTPVNTASLTLEGNIGVNLFIDLECYTDDADAYLVLEYDRPITIKGENLPSSVTMRGYDIVDRRIKISETFGAVQLINSVSVYLYDSTDKLLFSKENYTAMEFCKTVLANSSLYEEEFVELCTTLLNYGSMTQTYFNAQTGNLPNAGLDISGDVTSLDTSSWSTYYGEFSKDLPQYVGTSLICSSDMVVRHYFKDPIDGYEIELSSKPDGSDMAITTGDNTTGYYVEVYGIESPYLDSNYTITLKDAKGNTYTITYSPMCYARKTVSRSASKASLVNLCKSIYLYGSAAQEYFIGE